jgi:hypothetical protein
MSECVAAEERCECGQAPLVAERSVPVSGFSVALRQSEDVERYRFCFALRGDVATPVHVVFSRSLRRAEVKAGDLKALSISDVDSPCDAQRRWIAWWRGGRSAPRFTPPRRTGNAPIRAWVSS